MAFKVGDYVKAKDDYYASIVRGKSGRIASFDGGSYGVIFFGLGDQTLHDGIFETHNHMDLPQWAYSFQGKHVSFWMGEDELVLDRYRNDSEES